MILPDCRIIFHQNERSKYTGIDSPDQCLDPTYFAKYPHTVEYSYNSRGFRDQEWPQDVTDAVWCIGDSFTVGLGAPESHGWVSQLRKQLNRPCINVSMDGASNNWIGRWAKQIICQAHAQTIVVHWSFTHRRELELKAIQDKIWQEFYSAVRDSSWPNCDSRSDVQYLPKSIQEDLKRDPRLHCYTEGFDLESMRRLHHAPTTVQQDVENTVQIIHDLEQNKANCQLIYSHIPEWHPKTLKINAGVWVEEFDQIDYARDILHYDQKTAELFVNRILKVFEV